MLLRGASWSCGDCRPHQLPEGIIAGQGFAARSTRGVAVLERSQNSHVLVITTEN